MKRWEVESKKGKSWDQFSKELNERMDKRSVEPGGGQSLVEKVKAVLPIEKFKKRYPRAYELFWLMKDGFTVGNYFCKILVGALCEKPAYCGFKCEKIRRGKRYLIDNIECS